MRRFHLVLTAILATVTASATTFTVTNTSDSGAGSLRQAITDANANAGADTVDFNIPGSDPNCERDRRLHDHADGVRACL